MPEARGARRRRPDLYDPAAHALPEPDARGCPTLRRCHRLRHRRTAGWSVSYADLERLSDGVAVGTRTPRGRGRRRRRPGHPAGPGVRRRLPRGGEARRDHRRGQRPADAAASAKRSSALAAPRLVLAAPGFAPEGFEPIVVTPAETLDRRAGRRAGRRRGSPALARRPRPAGRDHLHVGDHRPPKGALYSNRQLSFITQTDVGDTWGGGAQLQRHVVRAPRLHDQAGGQPAARRQELHHEALARPRPRCA